MGVQRPGFRGGGSLPKVRREERREAKKAAKAARRLTRREVTVKGQAASRKGS
jgi:hypothetical protein